MTVRCTDKDLHTACSGASMWRTQTQRGAVSTKRAKLCTWKVLWVKQTRGALSPWI